MLDRKAAREICNAFEDVVEMLPQFSDDMEMQLFARPAFNGFLRHARRDWPAALDALDITVDALLEIIRIGESLNMKAKPVGMLYTAEEALRKIGEIR